MWSLRYEARRALFRVQHKKRARGLKEMRHGFTEAGYSFLPFIENECIFVHIPKCGGSSISQALFGNSAGDHIAIGEYSQAFSSREFNRYFKFTFVRNPWDRLVSAYHFMKQRNWDPAGTGSVGNLSEYPEFDLFVRGWLNPDSIKMHAVFRPQTSYIFRKDKLMVDFVGYLENIEDDFGYIRSKIGSDVDLLHLNQGKLRSSDYRDYYNYETIRIVENIYRDDITRLGYSFDNSSLTTQIATRDQRL